METPTLAVWPGSMSSTFSGLKVTFQPEGGVAVVSYKIKFRSVAE